MRIAADTTSEFSRFSSSTGRLGKSYAAALGAPFFSGTRGPGKEPVSAAINSAILNLDLSSSRLRSSKELVATDTTPFTTSSRLLHDPFTTSPR